MNIMKSVIQKKHSCSFTHFFNISPKQLNIYYDIYTNSSTYAVGRLTKGLGFPPTGDSPDYKLADYLCLAGVRKPATTLKPCFVGVMFVPAWEDAWGHDVRILGLCCYSHVIWPFNGAVNMVLISVLFDNTITYQINVLNHRDRNIRNIEKTYLIYYFY